MCFVVNSLKRLIFISFEYQLTYISFKGNSFIMFKKGKSSIIFIIIGIIIIVPTVFLFTNLGTLSDFFLELEQYKLSKTIEPIIETSSTTFITKWKTDNQGTSENNQIKLPLVSDGTYNFTIDWGDNTSDIITIYNQNEITHTYSNPGIYPIIIDGSITGFSFKTIYTDNKNMKIVKTDNEKLLEILQWGNLKLGNNEDYFRNCKYMTISASDILDLEGTTNLTRMFFGCKSIHKIPNIELWDISNITNLNSMFSSVTRFNQDISNWDVSNVTNMSHMFDGLYTHNPLMISNWDVSSVTDMAFMFHNLESFNQDLSSWNVSSVYTHLFFDEGAISWTLPRPNFPN